MNVTTTTSCSTTNDIPAADRTKRMVMSYWRKDKSNTIITQPPASEVERRAFRLNISKTKAGPRAETRRQNCRDHFASHKLSFVAVAAFLLVGSFNLVAVAAADTGNVAGATSALQATLAGSRRLFNPNKVQMGPNIFTKCAGESALDTGDGGTLNQTALIQCISDTFQEQEADRNSDLQSFLFVVAGAMIFFMQAGFAMLCAGSVRIKNVQNTMLKNLLDACGAALAFFLVGFAFAFGGQSESTATTFIGTKEFLTLGSSAAFWFFEYTFSATSVTIVAGTLAERCQMAAYLCYSVFLTGFVYPVIAHSIWSNNGFLSIANSDPLLGIGCVDFAGSGVVHVTGGTTALYATLILGPRRGRFFDAQGEPLETPKEFPGHSVALQLLGTMILWFGWFGFNP